MFVKRNKSIKNNNKKDMNKLIKILDKNGLEIEVGMIVKIKSNDVEDCVVCGFDNGRVDVIELGEGFVCDSNKMEVISELNG
jgi:hypothetical protein